MFRHCYVILRELVDSNLLSHTSVSNAAVDNTVYNYESQIGVMQVLTIVVEVSMLKTFKILELSYLQQWAKIILFL